MLPSNPSPLLPTILFDLDGTLVDSIDLIVRTWQATVSAHLGIDMPREEVVPLIGRSLDALLAELDPDRAPAMAAHYRALMASWHDTHIRGYDGIDALLEGLEARGIVVGLVTSKTRASAAPSLVRFGLEPRMAAIVTAEMTVRHKPDPEPLRHAASLLGRDPAACWYVGDSVHDMAAARAAGMTAVAALWGPTPRSALAPLSDHILERPEDLLGLV